jgi:hypothetical protein
MPAPRGYELARALPEGHRAEGMRWMKKRNEPKLVVRLTAVEKQQLQLVLDALDSKHGSQAQAIIRLQLARFGRGEYVKERLTRQGNS